MTIKQQGGIFGRNPTFNNLDVDGTTDLNSVNATSITATGLTVNAAQNTLLEADQSGTVRNLQISNADVAVNNRAGLYFQPSNSVATSYIDGVAEDDASTSAKRDGSIVFGTRLDGSFADQVKITSQGNIAILNSGKGIDFSATSGTGTSELFDDYEEGTWTPAFQNVTAPTYTVQSGEYTKIGNIVHFYLKITYSSLDTGDSSNMAINLPYTPSTKMCIARVSDVSDGFIVSDQYTSPIFKTSGSNILATGITDSNAADYQDMNATGTIVISGSYSV